MRISIQSIKASKTIINKIQDSNGKVKADSPACKELVTRIEGLLQDLMFNGRVEVEGKAFCSVSLHDVRLSDKYVNGCGYNVSPYSEGRTSGGKKGYHRSRVLGWQNWIDLANGMNDILDSMNLKAEISSSRGGQPSMAMNKRDARYMFLRTVEDGRVSEDQLDRRYGNDNVGSMMNPVLKSDAFHPEDEEKAEDCRKKRKMKKTSNPEGEL